MQSEQNRDNQANSDGLTRLIKFLFSDTLSDASRMGVWMVSLIFAGLFFCGIVAFSELGKSVFGTLALIGMATLTGGFFLGFLFGIPRVLQEADHTQKQTGPARYQQRVNTNLEQISDWLTKIIVGVGLVELKDAPGFIWHVSQRLSTSFAQDPKAPCPSEVPCFSMAAVVCVDLLFFGVLGILFGYLITRLYFASAFGRADQDSDAARGFQTGSVPASEVPAASGPGPASPGTESLESVTVVPPPPSVFAERLLATLWKYQLKYGGEDGLSRRTFAILPGAPLYVDYVKAVGELLALGLVVVSPENHQVMLSDAGLDYARKNRARLESLQPVV